MSKQPWALILGASSGFGEATALELARAGMNIFGVHLDRREKLPHVAEVQEKIRAHGPRGEFFNCNAADDETPQRDAWSRSGSACSKSRPGTVRVLMHSLAFGALKPLAGRRKWSTQEADRTHRRHHGPLAGLLGAGLPAGRPVRQGAARIFAMTSERRHARPSRSTGR